MRPPQRGHSNTQDERDPLSLMRAPGIGLGRCFVWRAGENFRFRDIGRPGPSGPQFVYFAA